MSQNSDPATGVVLMVPSDTVNQPLAQSTIKGIRSFYCNVSGNISYVCYDGTVGLVAALAGYVYPISIIRINATNTTATGIYGLL